MATKIVPVYLPHLKTTVMTPKVMAKLVFELNYKGLITTRTEMSATSDDEVLIEFEKFDEFRRCLVKWQTKDTAPNAAIWDFMKANVAIELSLRETIPVGHHPYVPILRLHVSKVDEFCALFYNAKFSK